jgi:hypothetical protein
MYRVDDVYDEAKKVVGSCDDIKLFRWLGDAVTLIANKADFEGWKGFIDICTTGQNCITLPREVETVIGVNLGGKPTLAYDQLFNFHLNGPGDCMPCAWSWQDQGGGHPTYRDIITPSKVIAHLSTPSDNGKALVVFGYDSFGNKLRRQVNGTWYDGYQVPTIYGYALPDAGAPKISRIVAVEKVETVGPVRLSTIDDSGLSGITLGIYEPDEILPQYRRIRVHASCTWARIAYRKINPTFHSRWDHVPLKSRIALLNGVRAVKFYSDTDLGNAHSFESDAARLEIEAQRASEPVAFFPIQVVDMNNPQDKNDYDIR